MYTRVFFSHLLYAQKMTNIAKGGTLLGLATALSLARHRVQAV